MRHRRRALRGEVLSIKEKSAAFTQAAGELAKAAAALAGLGPQADGAAVEEAVNKLHGRYQDLEKIFN